MQGTTNTASARQQPPLVAVEHGPDGHSTARLDLEALDHRLQVAGMPEEDRRSWLQKLMDMIRAVIARLFNRKGHGVSVDSSYGQGAALVGGQKVPTAEFKGERSKVEEAAKATQTLLEASLKPIERLADTSAEIDGPHRGTYASMVIESAARDLANYEKALSADFRKLSTELQALKSGHPALANLSPGEYIEAVKLPRLGERLTQINANLAKLADSVRDGRKALGEGYLALANNIQWAREAGVMSEQQIDRLLQPAGLSIAAVGAQVRPVVEEQAKAQRERELPPGTFLRSQLAVLARVGTTEDKLRVEFGDKFRVIDRIEDLDMPVSSETGKMQVSEGEAAWLVALGENVNNLQVVQPPTAGAARATNVVSLAQRPVGEPFEAMRMR